MTQILASLALPLNYCSLGPHSTSQILPLPKVIIASSTPLGAGRGAKLREIALVLVKLRPVGARSGSAVFSPILELPSECVRVVLCGAVRSSACLALLVWSACVPDDDTVTCRASSNPAFIFISTLPLPAPSQPPHAHAHHTHTHTPSIPPSLGRPRCIQELDSSDH